MPSSISRIFLNQNARVRGVFKVAAAVAAIGWFMGEPEYICPYGTEVADGHKWDINKDDQCIDAKGQETPAEFIGWSLKELNLD